MNIEKLFMEIIKGKKITRDEAVWLYNQPSDKLHRKANEIRKHFCSNSFDICAIINSKSGHCSEDCSFCAQSNHNHTSSKSYPLLSTNKIVAQAKLNNKLGIRRCSIVTSGKRLSDNEIEKMCEAIQKIRKDIGISVCTSFGLLNENQYKKLKNAGVTRVHNNLETSYNNFPNVCTTHSFDDKVKSIRAAQSAGLSVCSGGIMGLGETPEDRIDMALFIRDLGIKSVPINILNPIPGTPFENKKTLTIEDMCRIIAVYRFILPDAYIRLAGGRSLLSDKGKSCFQSGANATISGDMLTTAGITFKTDMKLLKQLGYKLRNKNEKKSIL